MWTPNIPFFKKNKAEDSNQQDEVGSDATMEDMLDEVPAGTKMKVVAAFTLVAFASYVAYWVQEPVEIKADVLQQPIEDQGFAPSSNNVAIDNPAAPTPAPATPPVAPAAPIQQKEVSITNFAYDAATLTIDKGTTVLWTNKDTVAHTVTSDSFTSTTLNPGQTYSYTFTTEGTFDYHCAFHPQMKGKVIVAVGASKSPTPAPATPTPTPSNPPAPTDAQQTAMNALNSAIETQPPASEEAVTETVLHQAATSESAQTLAPSESALGLQPSPSSDLSATPEQAFAESASAAQLLNQQAMAQSLKASAESQKKLTNSGPEDVYYFAAFLAILYLSRKHLLNRKVKNAA